MVLTKIENKKQTKTGLHVRISSQGIGDTLQGLYAVCGLQKKFPKEKVHYYTPRKRWAKLAFKESFDLVKAPKEAIELYHNYSGELEAQQSRVLWYCNALNVKPETPKLCFEKSPRIYAKAEKYIVLCPFSSSLNRNWSLKNWQKLEKLILGKTDFATVVIGSRRSMLRTLFKGYPYEALPPELLCNLIYNSAICIAPDSMAAHLSGMLGTTTLCIHSQISPYSLFSHNPNVFSMQPKQSLWPCTNCFFREKNGYNENCSTQCYALNSITPEQVFSKLTELTKT